MDSKRSTKRRYGVKRTSFKRRDQSLVLRKKPFTTESKAGRTRVFAGFGNGVIASSLVTRLRYSEVTVSSASIFNSVTFRLNSLFDPNYTSAGHQPMGFDQLAALYNRYRVDRCTVEVFASSSSATASGEITLWPSNDLMTLVSVNDVKEQPMATTIQVPGGGAVVHRKFTYYPYIIMGVTKANYASDDRHSAQVTANPTEFCGLHCCATLADTSLSTGLQINWKITYDCTFFDPFNVGGS